MTVGFIGAGNMGGALAAAVAKTVGGESVLLADPCADKVAALAAALGARVSDNDTVAKTSDYIFLGVKPQVMDGVLSSLDFGDNTPVLVSMAAGLSTAALAAMAAKPLPIIRIMPNTPVTVGKGMILYTATEQVSDEQVSAFLSMLAAAGRLDRIDEARIDAASAVSGCGPAFAYLFIEALADGGVECGLPRAQALEYAAQTVLGAAQMVLDTGRHPGDLKDAVCSPGGTTIAGVHALEDGALRATAMGAVTAAYQRTLELKK
ncbi:MAG: pyrroline-5-carboxylate reductase [Clostridia bacterium]|nr:pyrroline-5-carboxylate reductase [Clostridia bacterium]